MDERNYYTEVGFALRSQGKIEEAMELYKKMRSAYPEYTEALDNIFNIFVCLGQNKEALDLVHMTFALEGHAYPSDDYYRKTLLLSIFMTMSWIEKNIDDCRKLAVNNQLLLSAPQTERNKNSCRYFDLISTLVTCYDKNPEIYAARNEPFYVFGDSHCLSFANLSVSHFFCRSELIMGIKMWHLVDQPNKFFKTCLARRIEVLPVNSNLLFCIGEIDCRYNEGIWVAFKHSVGSLDFLVTHTTSGYLNWLSDHLAKKNPASVTICGIQFIDHSVNQEIDKSEAMVIMAMVEQVNRELKKGAEQRGWNFLDVWQATRNLPAKQWSTDGLHIQPKIIYDLLKSNLE